MRPFSYYKVASVDQAVALLAKHQQKAAILAGGSDLFGMMKDSIEGAKLKTPQYLIDIKGIKELNFIKEEKNALRIGAATPLSDIVSSELIAKKCPVLQQAASQVAVPQIRNVGTLGGNLCQRPRCWYFRGKQFDACIRKGGNNCYAAGGENRYHAVYGGGACSMVHPSDMATALTALNAKVEIASAKGKKESVPIDKFYVGPDKTVLAETILTPQEMVVAIEIPDAGPNKCVFLKLNERQAFDFAIASVAINVSLKNNAVEQARVAFGGVAPFPMRAAKVEAALKGKRPKDAIAAACAACAEGAQPLSQNAYKVAGVKGLLEAALTQVS